MIPYGMPVTVAARPGCLPKASRYTAYFLLAASALAKSVNINSEDGKSHCRIGTKCAPRWKSY